MGLIDLKLLFKKEYRIYLILIIWLIVGFTIYQLEFELAKVIAFVIFLPLIIVTFFFLIIAFFSKKRLYEMSKKRIIISFIIAFAFFWILFYIGYIFFWIGIFLYIILTSVFTMDLFLNLGIKIENAVWEKKSSKILRWSLFIGGIATSILMLIGTIILTESITGGTAKTTGFNTSTIALVIIVIIILFTILGLILAATGRLHAWMGTFFVGVSIYTIYLIISIIYKMSSYNQGVTSIEIQILLYFFNLFLFLYTISGLIGKKAEILQKKLKIFGPDTILLWLIFSLASYELAMVLIENASIARYIIVYVLFVPLLIILSFYGLIKYKNMISKMQKVKTEIVEEPPSLI